MNNERENRPFRNYLVCYNNHRCIGWRNIAELHELLNKGEVNWYSEHDNDKITRINIQNDKPKND